MQKVAVVIPIYQPLINKYEEISLNQCAKILGSHPIIFVCSDSLNTSTYLTLIPDAMIERFDNSYFEGLLGYNRLMLSCDFYKRFERFEYILIYQLDAYVFRDELEYWCNQGYDYIGAPWILREYNKYAMFKNIKHSLRKKKRLLMNNLNTWNLSHLEVGNGGFSLRNPRKFNKILLQMEHSNRFAKYYNPLNFHYNEDVFWSIEVNRYFNKLKIPSWRKALSFSFEIDPAYCFKLNHYNLPFGCHAFNKIDIEFWNQHIKLPNV